MRFNTLLRDVHIDPAQVSVIMHLTRLEPLRSLLPIIADLHPDLFDAYQSVHGSRAEATLAKRPLAASFVPIGLAQLVFAGLFEITGRQTRPVTEVYADPRFARLEREFGATDTAPGPNIARGGTQVHFSLTPRPELAEEIGRLRIAAPGTRAYVQIAANLDPVVLALTPRRHLSPPLPDWTEVILSKPEVVNLPPEWIAAMTQWRGVYLITDVSDGGRYVGSAYGKDNIVGRWRQHVAGNRGITAELRRRLTANFRFSILELVRHSDPDELVIRREHTWMNRLHTRDRNLLGLNL